MQIYLQPSRLINQIEFDVDLSIDDMRQYTLDVKLTNSEISLHRFFHQESRERM